jgi:hypothetical protein
VRHVALLLRRDSSKEKLIAISLRHPPTGPTRQAKSLIWRQAEQAREKDEEKKTGSLRSK